MIWSEERELRPEKAPDLREVKLFEDIFKKRYEEAKQKDYETGKKRRDLRLEKDPDPKSFRSNGLNALCLVKMKSVTDMKWKTSNPITVQSFWGAMTWFEK